LKKYAEEVGLDIAKFEGCLSGAVLKAAVQRDIDDGNRLGVTGTPAFFITRALSPNRAEVPRRKILPRFASQQLEEVCFKPSLPDLPVVLRNLRSFCKRDYAFNGFPMPLASIVVRDTPPPTAYFATEVIPFAVSGPVFCPHPC
jgi:hypothetical protein